MGWFGDVLKFVGKEMKTGLQDMQRYRDEYASYPDSKLISIARGEGVFGSKFTEKSVAYAILKDRYGEEEAKEKIRNGY